VEIRAALRDDPSGPPLLFLAPKQATFQLERQLLGDPDLAGYTRLHILSFQRLAEFILRQLRRPAPRLLSEEGRVMVLRALLSRHRSGLQIFHGSAGLAGFAGKLSVALRELQRRGLSPAALAALASRSDLSEPLRRKLNDLALLQGAYLEWLAQQNLQDADCLLDLAAHALDPSNIMQPPFAIAGFWLDGFGELAPQELNLLAALAPCCDKMTLAFCVDGERPAGAESWLSIWSAISRARDECWRKFSTTPGVTLETEVLRRRDQPGRFDDNPVLRHLEESWAAPSSFPERANADSKLGESLRTVVCANPEAEAVLAARELLQFVRAGGRFRDAAVLVRSMEGYHDVLRRVFSRYQIPFFLDRREPASRHPLAELTRNALRLIAFDWRHEDWFSALKTGLVSSDEEAIDRLENEALARGWTGATWASPFAKAKGLTADAEILRQQWVAPFLRFREQLAAGGRMFPDGPRLADALRELWHRLQIEESLAKIQGESPASGTQFHVTVWQQMNAWLDNVALAFPGEFLPLTEWLTLLEAGLVGITVGVIPPALDQVLIGAVDRSRNPDLQLAIVLGVNEGVFPAPPPSRHLLTDSDCEELEDRGLAVADPFRRMLGRERFLGYIACTRVRRRLVLTCARHSNWKTTGLLHRSRCTSASCFRMCSGCNPPESNQMICWTCPASRPCVNY
jgi:ATP-dependent helicase/nuclease subunit B